MVDRRTLLGASLLALAARPGRAQPPAPRRIGLLLNGTPGPLYDGIRRNMVTDFAAIGLVEGRDYVLEPAFAEGQLGRLPELAARHVGNGVGAIVALGGPAATAAQRATSSTPVVFSIVTDPVALGLVASLERPGGNATGATSLDPGQAEATMQLLKALVPTAGRVALLSDTTIPGADATGLAPIDRANKAAAEAIGLQASVVKVPGPTQAAPTPDFAAAFAAIEQAGARAVVVFDTPLNFANGPRIAALAAERRLPSIFLGGMAGAGGLVTYGTSVAETWRMLPAIVARIFRGTPPGEIPVTVATHRELVLNQALADKIGITFPPSLVARADRVVR